MRIDYSEPKQAYVTAHGAKRPRREPVGLITTIVIITGIITFIAGFGTGWLLSQRSAKKAFQAATQQRSLENAPRQEAAPPKPKTQPALPATAAAPHQPQQGAADVQSAPATQGPAESQLSFYKTLPGAQKGNVLGSGINSKDDKSKQPLQAAIPSNLTRPPQSGADTAKPSPADKSQPTGFTVQVASYSLKSEAETVKNKLAGKGYTGSVSGSA